MSVLRVASLAVMALWIGGLAALGTVAAPAVTDVLGQHDPVGGPALAELVHRHMLASFQRLSWILGGATMALLALRAALGPRPRRLAIQVWLVTAMLFASAFAQSNLLIALTCAAGLSVFYLESRD